MTCLLKCKTQFATAMLTAFFVIAATQCATAQEESQEEFDEEASMKQMIDEQVKNLKKSFSSRFAVRIEDLGRVCDLSEEQVGKLKTASKGALLKATSKQKSRIEKMMKGMMGGGMMGGAMIGGDGPGGEQVIEIIGGDFGMEMGGKGVDPEKEKIWMNALGKVLSEEQHEKYNSTLAARDKFLQTAKVDEFIARAELSLLLSVDQRTKLTKYIDKEYGEKFVEATKHGGLMIKAMQMMGGGMMVVAPGNRAEDTSSKSPVKEILSEQQFKIWQREMRPELEMLSEAADDFKFGG